jgi:hypothetical protein
MKTHIFYARKQITDKGVTIYWHVTPERKTLTLGYNCSDSEIVKIKATEREDQTLPKDNNAVNYIGWRKPGKDVPSLIQPCFLLFDMQFVAGVEFEVNRGKGVTVCMDFEEIEEDADENNDRGVE